MVTDAPNMIEVVTVITTRARTTPGNNQFTTWDVSDRVGVHSGMRKGTMISLTTRFVKTRGCFEANDAKSKILHIVGKGAPGRWIVVIFYHITSVATGTGFDIIET